MGRRQRCGAFHRLYRLRLTDQMGCVSMTMGVTFCVGEGGKGGDPVSPWLSERCRTEVGKVGNRWAQGGAAEGVHRFCSGHHVFRLRDFTATDLRDAVQPFKSLLKADVARQLADGM